MNLEDIQIVILAGGKGTRLLDIAKGLPKPLVPINQVAVIEHQIRLAQSQGFSKATILLSYQAQKIIEYLENLDIDDFYLEYIIEEKARGTGGALLDCYNKLGSDFLVLYADTFILVDLPEFVKTYFSLKADINVGAQILVHPNSHPHDSDLVEMDDEGLVTGLHGYPREAGLHSKNMVNAACYMLSKEALDLCKKKSALPQCDIAKDLIPQMLKNGLKINGYETLEYIKDMGTPNRLAEVENSIDSGKLKNRSFSTTKEVVFVDRDGCLNHEVGRITDPNKLRLIAQSGAAIQLLNENSLPVICVTNQPGVARGDISATKLNEIHNYLDYLLGLEDAFLDDIFYCPHHPDRGYEGEVPNLKITCDCRKPEIGLFHAAAKKYRIDFKKSWMIGDMTSDVLAANKTGLKSILLDTGHGGLDLKHNVKPDYIFSDLYEACNWIVAGYQQTKNALWPSISKILEAKIILVTGKSRSGKSTVAQVIKDVVQALGKNVNLIHADTWLKPDRMSVENDSVVSRYDMLGIEATVSNLHAQQFPIYHNHKVRAGYSNELSNVAEVLFGNSLSIIEGIPLLLSEKMRGLADQVIHVSVDENNREKRLTKKYQSRGLGPNDINQLLRLRAETEDQLIDQSKKHSTIFLDF